MVPRTVKRGVLGVAILLALVATPATASPSQQGAVGMNDASGCNANVCISLQGHGLTVDSWHTSAYVGQSWTCRTAYFHIDGQVWESQVVCGSGRLETTWYPSGSFSDPSQACNSWEGVTGYPCKTIYSG